MGRNVALLGLGKDRLERRIDRFGFGLSPLTTVAAGAELVGYIDQAAGINSKIGRV